MFIKVTRRGESNLFLNVALIDAIEENLSGSMIHGYQINETPEEILELIRVANIKKGGK